MNNRINSYFEKTVPIIEQNLEKYLTNKNDNGLSNVMKYSLLSGGKRLRPIFTLESYKLFSNGATIEKALPYACALEMIHTYSLIHDDLPCMDNDEFRRGMPTNHMVFGEAQALLAGDTLLTYAFEIIATNNLASFESRVRAVEILSKYAGFSGMAGGQMIDLDSSNNISSLDELFKMHSLKTSGLIKAALVLGYVASCDKLDNLIIKDLEKIADNIGISFQIRDDILDETSNLAILGKKTGSDSKNGKATALKFLTINEAEAVIDNLTNEAILLLEKYYTNDKNDCMLIELAKYLINREK
ncbi:MAG: polyprenyl synthetase family protein [Clostridia bacterium]|nr:polyprenyl synthetase family protein [Clostridia bacterium]